MYYFYNTYYKFYPSYLQCSFSVHYLLPSGPRQKIMDREAVS